MKILVINTVPTAANGITNVILNYIGAMDKQDLAIDYLSISDPESSYCNILDISFDNWFVLKRSPKSIVSYFFGLRKLILTKSYDVVHVHGNSHTVVLELLASFFGGCKRRIVHAHTTKTSHKIMHFLLLPLFRALCTKGVACGSDAAKWMFGKREGVLILKNGVNVEKFAFDALERGLYRERLGWGEDLVVLGHVGYFLPVKNQSYIVDIFNEVYKTDRRYRLLLIGDGELKPYVEQKVSNLGLSDVIRFTGDVTNVNSWLNAIDVILMPSLHEGLPLTLVEQQASGLLCVVSDTITKEVDLTGLVSFLPLSTFTNEWVEKVKEIAEVVDDRKKKSDAAILCINKEGYNISMAAEDMKLMYINK